MCGLSVEEVCCDWNEGRRRGNLEKVQQLCGRLFQGEEHGRGELEPFLNYRYTVTRLIDSLTYKVAMLSMISVIVRIF